MTPVEFKLLLLMPCIQPNGGAMVNPNRFPPSITPNKWPPEVGIAVRQ
jgi:hypothetical protein